MTHLINFLHLLLLLTFTNINCQLLLNKLYPQRTHVNSKLVIELKQIDLIEETNYINYLIFNFASYVAANDTRLIGVDATKLKMLAFENGNQLQQSNNAYLQNKFYLNQTNLYVNGKLDREYLIQNNDCYQEASNKNADDCLLKLKLALYDSNNNLINIFVLPINIIDLNDNRPLFKSEVYYLNISENLITRTVLPLEAPVDLDSPKFGIKNCSISSMENEQDNKLFEAMFNQMTSRLFLILNSPLDRELKSSYELKLTCTDDLNSTSKTSSSYFSSTKVIINVLDANDNIPVFKHDNKHQLNVSVNENELNDHLIKIEAYDNDDPKSPNGQLAFSLPIELNYEKINDLFKINETTGLISLIQPLDYEVQKKYLLKVKVQDLGANPVPIYTDVLVNVIDLNDNKPNGLLTFNENYAVKENKQNLTIWIYEELKFTADSPVINLAYLSLSDSDTPMSNGYNLSATIEEIQYLNTTSQIINKEVLLRKEDSLTFKLVPIVKEYDNMYYVLQLLRPVDREQKQYFDLKLKLVDNANDNENNVQLFNTNQLVNHLNVRIVLIDINDNKPEFKETVKEDFSFEYYKFQVNENQLKLNFAKIVAYDLDEFSNSQIEFKLLDDNNPELLKKYLKLKDQTKYVNINPNYLFYVDPDNGSISLRAELDREQRDLYLFTIRATDKCLQADQVLSNEVLVELTILDENDNQPVYHTGSKEFKLDENCKLNTLVGNVKAYDADFNPKIDYSIDPVEMNDYFRIDATTGNLLTKKLIDAEQLAKKLVNNTFQLQITAKDSEFDYIKSAQYVQLSKLNVSIYVNDMNDNAPFVVYPQNEQDKLIALNLKDYQELKNNSMKSSSLNLKLIKTTDLDRDAFLKNRQRPAHTFELVSIRRLSWQFVYEIVKNQLTTLTSNDTKLAQDINDIHTDYKKILEFLEYLIELQKTNQIKPTPGVNMRSLFSLHTQKSIELESSLNLNQVKTLNWGIYNFSIQINDSSLTTDLSIKLFVLNITNENKSNSTTQMLSPNQLVKLNNVLESWWSVNSNLVTSFKKRLNPSFNLSSKDDNGDEIDSIAQEYYKYYASTDSSSISKSFLISKTNDFLNMTTSFLNTASMFLINNSSSSIIILISVFLVISFILVLFITYKYNKHAKMRNTGSGSSSFTSSSSDSVSNKKYYKKHLKKTNKGANGNNFLDLNLNHQKISLSSSSSIGIDCLAKSNNSNEDLILNNGSSNQDVYDSCNGNNNENNQVVASSATNEFMVKRYFQALNQNLDSSSSTPTTTSNNNQIVQATNENLYAVTESFNNAANSNSKNEGNSLLKKNSISSSASTTSTSSSVTPVTTVTNASSNQINLIEPQSSSKFLSTFIASSVSSSKTPIYCGQNANGDASPTSINLQNDIGYYGSSDYSDNNGSFMNGAKLMIAKNTTSLSNYQKPPQYLPKVKILDNSKYMQRQNNANIASSRSQQQANSFTSSSLLSSPTSSSASSSSDCPLYNNDTNQATMNNNGQQSLPVITNLYPSDEANNQLTSKPTDVKIYLERFERIYNSDQHVINSQYSLTNSANKPVVIKNHQHQQQQQGNRNSLTAYSYV